MVKKIYFNGDIVTTGLVNSLYGAIPELTGAVGEDILASGHRHDGGDSEGHCGKIDLAREVRGILPITHIDTATLTTTVQTSVDSTVDAKIKAGDDALRLSIAANSNCIGDLKVIAGAGAATGWLICNGAAVPSGGANDGLYAPLRSYIDLNATYLKISGVYYVPDLCGRTVIGAGNVTGDPVTKSFDIGVKGGEINHTLIPDEMPAHSHVVNMGLCGHQRQSGGDLSYTVQGDNNNAIRADVPTTPTVSSTSIHNNMQPYLPLTWVIKAY